MASIVPPHAHYMALTCLYSTCARTLHGFYCRNSGPVPVLEVIFRELRTEDRTGPPLTTRTGTGTAVLIGPRRTAVQSPVRTGPGLHSGPDQSWTRRDQSWTRRDQSWTGPAGKESCISAFRGQIITFYISLEDHRLWPSNNI